MWLNLSCVCFVFLGLVERSTSDRLGLFGGLGPGRSGAAGTSGLGPGAVREAGAPRLTRRSSGPASLARSAPGCAVR